MPSSKNDIVDPHEPYISQTLYYERYSCRGFLKKMPKDTKFWQKSFSLVQRFNSKDKLELIG